MKIDLFEYSMQTNTWNRKQTLNVDDKKAKEVIKKYKNNKFCNFYRFECETGEVIYSYDQFIFEK